MYTAPLRKLFLGALAALVLITCVLLADTPKASASLSQCPANSVCIWELSGWTGEFSHWAASETGCHNHSKFLSFRSGYNNTSVKVRFGSAGVIPPGEAFYRTAGEPSITGEVCWPA